MQPSWLLGRIALVLPFPSFFFNTNLHWSKKNTSIIEPNLLENIKRSRIDLSSRQALFVFVFLLWTPHLFVFGLLIYLSNSHSTHLYISLYKYISLSYIVSLFSHLCLYSFSFLSLHICLSLIYLSIFLLLCISSLVSLLR